MNSGFYRAFEDKHRGSRASIKQRLRVYLPFIHSLTDAHPSLAALDLGCGRGEWLELLLEKHISAQGIDLDAGMLAACQERGLSVINADAIDHLRGQPSQSLHLITGFHIAEHLPFEALQTLFKQAHRTLAPGGLLILETPNPENLLVGAANFYIDPTHQRPLPSQLLTFLAEHHGFARVKLLRLQEEERLVQNGPASLYDVLANASPDYAIVAQVAPNCEPGATSNPALEQAFASDTGLSLHTLANRHDAHTQHNFERLQVQLQTSQQALHAVSIKADEALALGQQAAQLAAQLGAMHASQSWRLTRPLRWLSRLLGSGTRQR